MASIPDSIHSASQSPYFAQKGVIKLSRTPTNQFIVTTGVSSKTTICQTYAFSTDSNLVALATSDSLTLRQVSNGSIINTLRLANPAYSFSTTNELYIVDQLNPTYLKSIDSQGKVDSVNLKLPAAVRPPGYRIDQIQPDSNWVFIRSVNKNGTNLTVWDYGQQKSLLTPMHNELVNLARVESINANRWLIAAYQTGRQGYALLLAQPGTSSTTSLTGQKTVREYQLDKQEKIVALLADSSLITANLRSANPQSTTTIATRARYFDWRDNTVVYWKQRDPLAPNKWGLYTYTLNDPPPPPDQKSGFWYDTDLRRDVPRITLRDKDVYFEDRSNNTTNLVLKSRLSVK